MSLTLRETVKSTIFGTYNLKTKNYFSFLETCFCGFPFVLFNRYFNIY